MSREPESRDSRRDDIRQRRCSIDARLDELKAMRQDDKDRATSRERAESARRNLATAQAAASRAAAASADAFRRAARAHERMALHHERAAATGDGDKGEHERQAAIHRAAQARDTRRAEQAEALVPAAGVHGQDSQDAGSQH